MPSHLQEFAHEMVARHGPRTTGMILQAFTNIGNYVPGISPEDQLAAVEAALNEDPRFEVISENPGRGGDWYGHKENHE